MMEFREENLLHKSPIQDLRVPATEVLELR